MNWEILRSVGDILFTVGTLACLFQLYSRVDRLEKRVPPRRWMEK